MIFVYLVAFSAIGLGIWMAVTGDMLDTTHAIVGLVVLGSLVAQPFTGFIHHFLYKRRGKPDLAEILHVWWGRAIVVVCPTQSYCFFSFLCAIFLDLFISEGCANGF